MSKNPFDPLFEDLPESLPIFPLEGILLLPQGDLPLNIFEPRYIAMVDDALRSNRLIGMIQPSGCTAANGPAIFSTGCAGRITQFQETEDGRYLLNLRGLCRFRVEEELPLLHGYRRVKPDWTNFGPDMEHTGCPDLDRAELNQILKVFFEQHGLTVSWALIEDIPNDGLVTALAMVCPLSPSEKQALLEAPCCQTRANLLFKILDLSVHHSFHGCLSEH